MLLCEVVRYEAREAGLIEAGAAGAVLARGATGLACGPYRGGGAHRGFSKWG